MKYSGRIHPELAGESHAVSVLAVSLFEWAP
jgi:hypothetical protein